MTLTGKQGPRCPRVGLRMHPTSTLCVHSCLPSGPRSGQASSHLTWALRLCPQMHLPLTGCEGYRPVRTGRHTGTRGTGYHGALWVGWEQLVHFQNTCVQGEQLHALMAARTMGQTSPMLGLWTKQDPEPTLLRRPHPRHPTGPGLELLSGPHCACWCGRTLPSSAGPLHLHKVPNSSSSGS